MKVLRRALLILFALACGVMVYALASALSPSRPVGFQLITEKGADDQALSIALWYPASGWNRPTTLLGMVLMSVVPDATVEGRKLPLVVISHGNGGGAASHADLALYLASAGYVVAAPFHPGDNFRDRRAVASPTLFQDRGRHIKSTVDIVLNRWRGGRHIDPGRVGAFGFSAGATTVLSLVGAKPNLSAVPEHCARSPEFICQVLAEQKSPLLTANRQTELPPFVTDPRLKAAVVAAPGLGFTMRGEGLTEVSRPIQLWSAELDQHVPYFTNAKVLRDGLRDKVEFLTVPNAHHASFLVPCGPISLAALCGDPPRFDRRAFHTFMNEKVLSFFDVHLALK